MKFHLRVEHVDYCTSAGLHISKKQCKKVPVQNDDTKSLTLSTTELPQRCPVPLGLDAGLVFLSAVLNRSLLSCRAFMVQLLLELWSNYGDDLLLVRAAHY